MNELADKLEQPGIKLMIPEETELQAKAVRFAADMERLIAKGWGIKISGPWTDGGYVIETQYETLFSGPCIYSVARKAVEALEEK